MKLRKNVLTKEQEKFLIDNYKSLPAREIAKHLKVSSTKIYNAMGVLDLVSPRSRQKRKPELYKKVSEEFFNVHQHENWII